MAIVTVGGQAIENVSVNQILPNWPELTTVIKSSIVNSCISPTPFEL